MNPDSSQVPGLPLPQSTTPAGAYSFAPQPQTQAGAEKPQDVAPTGAIQVPPAPTRDEPVPAPIITATDTNDSDDTDDADEPWISKAQEVIEQTRDDPFSQTRALSRLRGDYLKSRFNRESKLGEDAAK